MAAQAVRHSSTTAVHKIGVQRFEALEDRKRNEEVPSRVTDQPGRSSLESPDRDHAALSNFPLTKIAFWKGFCNDGLLNTIDVALSRVNQPPPPP